MASTDLWCSNCERSVHPQTTASAGASRQILLGMAAAMILLPFYLAGIYGWNAPLIVMPLLMLTVVGAAAYRSRTPEQHCPICKSPRLREEAPAR